jgi:hypothetical protein
MAAVVEDAIDKLLKHADKGEDNIYIYRYNLWINQLYEEVDKNENVDTSKLLVSKFMEQSISHHIVIRQRARDIYSNYNGWRTGDRFHYNNREKEIKKLYSL